MLTWILGIVAVILLAIAMLVAHKRGNERAQPILFQLESSDINQKLSELHSAGNLDEIEKFMKKVFKKFPYAAQAYFQLIDLLIEEGEFIRARKYILDINSRLIRSLEPDPSDLMGIRVRLVKNFIATREYNEAEKYCLETFKMRYSHHVIGILYAEIAKQKENIPEYVDRLILSSKNYPSSTDIRISLAQAYYALEKYNEGDSVIRQAIEEFPHTISLMISYARSAHERGDWEEAAERWAAVRDDFALNPEGFVKGSEALMKLGRVTEGEQLLARHPGEAAVHWPLR